MPSPTRSSDLQETYGARALGGTIGGAIALVLGILGFIYGGAGGVGLAAVLTLAGLAGLVYGIMNMSKVKGVSAFSINCPYCNAKNAFTTQPTQDVRCNSCNRQIAIQDGRILRVTQVRCGFCNELNWYSERSVGLICESCNREIPISTADGSLGKTAMSAYTQHDDDKPYDLILQPVSNHHNEGLISTLQHMLALNRNQVKQILEEAPVTLLTGIPRKKAEMMRAQLSVHEAEAEIRVTGS